MAYTLTLQARLDQVSGEYERRAANRGVLQPPAHQVYCDTTAIDKLHALVGLCGWNQVIEKMHSMMIPVEGPVSVGVGDGGGRIGVGVRIDAAVGAG